MRTIPVLFLLMVLLSCSGTKSMAESNAEQFPIYRSSSPEYDTSLIENEELRIKNVNTIFLDSDDEGELEESVELGKKNNLKILLVARDDGFFERALSLPLDGVIFSDYTPSKARLAELMLYKPYLLLMAAGESPEMESLIEEGYLDAHFELPLTDSENDKDGITKVPLPVKRSTPEQFVGLSFENFNESTVTINGHNKELSASKWVYFRHPGDSIEVSVGSNSYTLNTAGWSIPYKYVLHLDGTVSRKSPWVEFRRHPGKQTSRQTFDILAKTDPTAKGSINGKDVRVYKTGVFFDQIAFQKGLNRIRADVTFDDESTTFYETEANFDDYKPKRKAFPLWVDLESFSPSDEISLTPQDVLHLEFTASKGQQASVSLGSTGQWFPCIREDFDDFSTYRLTLPLEQVDKLGTHEILVRMNGNTVFSPRATLSLKKTSDFPLVRTTRNHVRMTYNLGPVRLGGPIRAEFNEGIVMQTNGKIGDYYRVKLNSTETGMVHRDDVVLLQNEQPLPPFFITNILTTVTDSTDVVSIPYLQPIPYEVVPVPDQERIAIRLFGAQTSSTWISHRANLKLVDKVTWQQTDPQTYEVYINLKTSKLWGYDVVQNNQSLQVVIKHPPTPQRSEEHPLKDLSIALEAGHGGSSTGASGLSGTLEKDINLALALTLGELLIEKGAEVIQVRPDDRDLSLLEKRSMAEQSGADLFVSIHANSAGGHFLRVSGTSTYYHNPFWAPLAESLYDRLLETGLPEFGVVGSFNYTPIRTSRLPAILVEQAFLSHAVDEEKMTDPEFRKHMAEKIVQGICDYLDDVLGKL